MAEIVNIAEQFRGLPMEDLIAGPIMAACDAQTKLTKAMARYIDEVGMNTDSSGNKTAKTVDFSMNRPVHQQDGTITQEKIDMSVPFLAITAVLNLQISDIDVEFNMEVKSSFSDKQTSDAQGSFDAKMGWGPFSVHVHGSVSSHRETTRQSDNSAKYNVKVKARQMGTPEGLSRVFDLLNSAITPKAITSPQQPSA